MVVERGCQTLNERIRTPRKYIQTDGSKTTNGTGSGKLCAWVIAACLRFGGPA